MAEYGFDVQWQIDARSGDAVIIVTWEGKPPELLTIENARTMAGLLEARGAVHIASALRNAVVTATEVVAALSPISNGENP